MALTYTTIQHDYRKSQGLSWIEYGICDMVYFLATNPSSKVPGWCWMSRAKMAEEVGISKRQIQYAINKLEADELLIRDPDTNYLKCSEKWSKVYFKGGAEFAHPVQDLHGRGAEIARDAHAEFAPNNNRLDKDRDNNKSEDLVFESLLEKSQKIFLEAGVKGVFFAKMKQLHVLSDQELRDRFTAWKKKHQNLGTEFKNDQHLRNSFNRFLVESKQGGGKTSSETVSVAKAGRMI